MNGRESGIAHKYSLLKARVAASGIVPAQAIQVPEPAVVEEIARAHDVAYVRRVLAGTLGERELRRVLVIDCDVHQGNGTHFKTVSLAVEVGSMQGFAAEMPGTRKALVGERGSDCGKSF